MVGTNNGFEIAEADLKLRGPGNIQGTQQSGIINFRIADLAKDTAILQTARDIAQVVLKEDPQLKLEKNVPIQTYLNLHAKQWKGWSRIS